MARRLQFIGTNSGNSGCPTLHEDLDSGEVLVQGDAVTDPDDVAQLRNVKDGEGFVVVPRVLLADFAPKEAERVSEMISFDEFEAMFKTCEHTAWRLESRRRYASDEETETYHRFARGEDPRWDLDDPWCVTRREQSALGKRFERVRVVDSPPTVGQRYLLDNARRNSAVGEDIRNLWRADAERLRLPDDDFWLFDSRVIARLHFDDDDQLTGVELITDPVEVSRASQVRDAAWHHAVPYERFTEQVPSSA
ncbi:hypothetical protein KQY30_20285 [Streptomyces sp. GMY02]|uniref:DUF6879 family protein n=1 Tax=Streptomyces sp. GMY02 TaxID=1333528 RepID=UPI001C2CAFEF|nr:DUF6879 family protein [Streptomyces sp. GMY02]QXE36233.1 hypothetical protein KQY30_20285 [Streptomyces sp. GMY02]